MGRKNKNALARGRLVANREQRGGKVIAAFRRVHQDDADLISARLVDLAQSNDIPALKVARGLRAFVLDPRLSGRDFNRGYLSAVMCRSIIDEALDREGVDTQSIEASLGEPELLDGKRRTVLVPLGSKILSAECRGFNLALANHNVPGFSTSGKQRGRRDMVLPKIAVATFDQPISRKAEPGVMEAVSLGLELAFVKQSGRVALGPLNVSTYQVERSPAL